MLSLLKSSDFNYKHLINELLPSVQRPGSIVGALGQEWCSKYGFSSECKVVAGTTDSIAAFLAAGPTKPGLYRTYIHYILVFTQY